MKAHTKFLLLSALCGISLSANAALLQQDRFYEVLQCHTSPDKPGIAVRLEHQGKTIFSGASGLRSVNTSEPLSTSDQFQIGSVTKQFTAAAILKLSEQGKLSLTDKLGDIISTAGKAHQQITILSLLSHTSGLEDYFDKSRITSNWHQHADVDQVMAAISSIPLQSDSGKAYSYSNVGYLLLGRVIEIASGKSYAGYLKSEFFAPLNMHSTFVMERGDKLDLVQGYSLDDDKLVMPDVVDRSWIYSAGAIVSTLDDLSRWHKAFLAGKVISSENYQLMVSKALLNNGEPINYGLGLDIYPISNLDSYSHQGMVPGFMAWMVYFPDEELFAAAFSNNDRQHPGPALLDMISMQLGMSPQRIPEDGNADMEKLVGKYRFDDGDTLEIIKEGNQFFAKSQDFEKRPLLPRKNQAFSYQCTENYYQLREADGKVMLYPVHIYHGEGKPAVKL